MLLSAAITSQDTQHSLLNSVVQQEIAQRRQRVGIQRQDTRLSVKSLIESIEKSSHVKAGSADGISGSHCSSSSSINSMMSDAPITRQPVSEWAESNDQSAQVNFIEVLRICFIDMFAIHKSLWMQTAHFHFKQMHASFTSKSPMLEKPVTNFNCDATHNKNANNSMAKLNTNKSTESAGLQSNQSNANNTMDISQKYGFIIGEWGVNWTNLFVVVVNIENDTIDRWTKRSTECTG